MVKYGEYRTKNNNNKEQAAKKDMLNKECSDGRIWKMSNKRNKIDKEQIVEKDTLRERFSL